MLLCYEDEGVYVNTYGRIIKDVVLQWGEMPTSVGESGGGLSPKAAIQRPSDVRGDQSPERGEDAAEKPSTNVALLSEVFTS